MISRKDAKPAKKTVIVKNLNSLLFLHTATIINNFGKIQQVMKVTVFYCLTLIMFT